MAKSFTEAAAAPGGAAETDLDASQVNGACYEICAVLETGESLRPLQPLTSQTDSGGEQSSAVLEGGGWGWGGKCAPSSARQTLMAVKWMLQPSLLLRFRLSSLGAPCLSGGLEEAASSQKAEFAAALAMLRISLSLSLSFSVSLAFLNLSSRLSVSPSLFLSLSR